MGSVGSPIPTEPFRKFYTDNSGKKGIEFEDLTDPWTALKISGYSTGEFWGYYHFDYNGHTLLAYLITHTLISRKLIPFH
jgi:hypothetical protein